MSLPPNKELLKRFPNQIYVETGIWRGDSIQEALDAGFEKIVGIDVDQTSIDFCISRFDLLHNVELSARMNLHVDDSAEALLTHIAWVTVPCTILLDAHWQLLEGTKSGKHPFPLMKELQQLRAHPVKTHTIIIDDLLYMTHPRITGWHVEELKSVISEINDNYEFEYVANPVIENMLVAWVP